MDFFKSRTRTKRTNKDKGAKEKSCKSIYDKNKRTKCVQQTWLKEFTWLSGARHLEEPVEIISNTKNDGDVQIASAFLDTHQRIQELNKFETKLDELIEQCQDEMKVCSAAKHMNKYSYVTYQDIRGIEEFNDKTVIAIKAPPETKLEVPDPAESIQIWLKSSNGPIDVYLCPDKKENIPPTNLKVDDECVYSDSSNSSSESPLKQYGSSGDISSGCFEEENFSHNRHNKVLSHNISFSSINTTLSHNTTLSSMNCQPINQFDPDLTSYGDCYNNDLAISPLISLEPNFKAEDYLFSLDSNEGITDLFDVDTFL